MYRWIDGWMDGSINALLDGVDVVDLFSSKIRSRLSYTQL